MTLSERITAARVAKKAKLAQREANRKPVAHKPMRMPVQQNKLLLVSDPQRFTANELLDSQIKVHLYLQLLLDEHDPHYVRYFVILLATVRAICLIQHRPQLLALVEKAEAELANSATCRNRPHHFVVLTALASRYADDLADTSATLNVECNNHAIHVLTLNHIGDLLALPGWTFTAFGQVMAGAALKPLATSLNIKESTLKSAVLNMAKTLFDLYYINDWPNITEPKTITDCRRHGKRYIDYLAQSKITARHATRAIMDFQRLFGCSLIDMDKLQTQLQVA